MIRYSVAVGNARRPAILFNEAYFINVYEGVSYIGTSAETWTLCAHHSFAIASTTLQEALVTFI